MEGGRGGVLPNRLTSGSGHHRPDVCVSSHGRKQQAKGHPDFFTLLCSPPGALHALDALYVPNAALCQSLESAIYCGMFPFLSCFLFVSFQPFLYFSTDSRFRTHAYVWHWLVGWLILFAALP